MRRYFKTPGQSQRVWCLLAELKGSPRLSGLTRERIFRADPVAFEGKLSEEYNTLLADSPL